MTEPSQYFKGRTVQEQMDEVIGYVDNRAEEVAAAKANDVLQPAEAAKTAAQAAAQEAEAAKNATIAALPTIQQDISDLKTENVALDGRLNTVELKVQTAEGNIVTIQGQIVALQTADGQNVKINNVNQYAVGLTGNQGPIAGEKTFANNILQKNTSWSTAPRIVQTVNIDSTEVPAAYIPVGGGFTIRDMNNRIIWNVNAYRDTDGRDIISFEGASADGTTGYFHLELGPSNQRKIITNFSKPTNW